MKVKSVHIEKFRSIADMQLECKPGINVIAGINGSGKSTLLDAIELGMSWVKARVRLKTASGAYPEFTDIRKASFVAKIGMKVLVAQEETKWEVVRVSPEYRGVDRPKSDLVGLTELADKLFRKYMDSEGRAGLPMIVKYSVNRSLIEIPMRVRKKHELDALSLYTAGQEGGSNLRSFYEWFREREDIEREEREELRSFEYQDSQLLAVRRAISSILPGYGDLHTRRKTPAGFELRKNGNVFRVEELSDGEKCYLTLIGDIARRLAICNPGLENPLEGEGIVLIDELELHLHPQWQGEAIERLRNVFPGCQFFITTHSPHIVQNLRLADNDTLIVMKDGKALDVGSRYGSPLEDVLSEVFGLDCLRPAPVAHAMEKVWELLDAGVCEGDELDIAIRRLKDMIVDSDPEFARINLQLALNRKNR